MNTHELQTTQRREHGVLIWEDGGTKYLQLPRRPGKAGGAYLLIFLFLSVIGLYFLFVKEHVGGFFHLALGLTGLLFFSEFLFRTTLSLSSNEYVLHRQLFGKGRTWRFPATEVSHIEVYNNRGTWIAFLVLLNGKRFRVSSLLKQEQANLIANELAPSDRSLLESEE